MRPARVPPGLAAPGAPLLDLANLRFSRGSGDQCFSVDLDWLRLAPGEVLALTGESGCGKSTVLELIGLVARPAPGTQLRLTVADHTYDLAALWQRNAYGRLAAVRATALGFVLQTGGLLPYLTVQDNIRINRRLLRLPDSDDELEVIIDTLELRDLLQKRPGRLSVGQQQRVAIARALAHRPALLLADEPTSALDPRLGEKVMALMFELAERLGIGVILATHEHARVRAHGLRTLAAEPLADRLGSRFCEFLP